MSVTMRRCNTVLYFVLAQRTQPFPMFVQSESVLHDGPRCPTTHLPWVAGTAVQCFGRLVVQRRQPLMPSQSESPLHCGPFMWPKQSCPWLAATPLAITIVIAAAEKSTVRVIAGGATMIAHPLRRPLLQMIRADDELLYNVALSRSKQASRGEQRRAEASET